MNIRFFIAASFTVLLTLTVVSAASNLVYSLALRYDGTTLTNEELRLIEGSAPERLNQPESGFTLKVIGFGGGTLHSFRFSIGTVPMRDPPMEIFSENGTQIAIPEGQPTVPEETKTVLVIPYFENAQSIEIYNDSNRLMLSVDISKYSKKIGNGNSPQGIDSSTFYIIAAGGIALIFISVVVLLIKKRVPHRKR